MNSPVEAFQSPWELEHLVALVTRLQPETILEVGAMYGGTLWHWLQHSVRVVVVDDEMRNVEQWGEWSRQAGTSLDLIQGSSHDPEVVAKAQTLGPYDFAFIDADHTFESVRADWENYGPLAKVVAFHDILPRPAYGVSALWELLKATEGARYMEICQNEVMPGNEGRCGVGILWT